MQSCFQIASCVIFVSIIWLNTYWIKYVVIYLCNHNYILHILHFIGTKWAGILKEGNYRLKFFLKWHKTLAFPLPFRMFSHTSKKKCGQFPIELLHKRGLTNKSLCQCPFFSSQRPKAHLHEKKTLPAYKAPRPCFLFTTSVWERKSQPLIEHDLLFTKAYSGTLETVIAMIKLYSSSNGHNGAVNE